MKLITRLLLLLFTAISAYVTFTLTYSLANNAYQTVAFGTLGICFDILKCLLPATIISCFASKEWGKLSATTIAYICLTAFSFYASTELFDASASRKIDERVKATVAYQTLEKQLNNFQKSYDELVAMQHISKADERFSAKLEATGAKMTALIETAHANQTQSLADLAMTIIVSLLLELSVVACHITLSMNAPVKAPVNAPVDKSSRNAPNLASTGRNTHRGTRRGAVTSGVTLDDLVTLLRSNHEAHLSQRDIKAKYRVSSDKAAQAKKILAEKTETSNLIILPTTTTTTKRAN